MTEKKTVMVLKVDLQCPCCYKKIQKILCKIPQITDRVFDERANMVIITVKCCSPEKIRDKLCCKGGKIIKSIEIKEPPKPPPKEAEKPKEAPKPKKAPEPDEADAPAPKEKPADALAYQINMQEPKPTPGLAVALALPTVHPCKPCCGPCHEGHPAKPCCEPCHEGHVGWPCYYGYGFPPPPPRPCYCGNGKPFYVTRCDCFSEEDNPTGCTIM